MNCVRVLVAVVDRRVGAVDVVQRIVPTPEPSRRVAASVTVDRLRVRLLLQAAPLQRTVSVGGVASATSVNDAAPEVRPAPFVDVTRSAGPRAPSSVS